MCGIIKGLKQRARILLKEPGMHEGPYLRFLGVRYNVPWSNAGTVARM